VDPTGAGPNRRFIVAFRREDEQTLGGIYYANKVGAKWYPATSPTYPNDNCFDSVYSLERSNADPQTVYAGSGNPRGCFLESSDKGVTWTYVTDDFGGQTTCVNVVDLVETTTVPPTLYAAVFPTSYAGCLEQNFGGVFMRNYLIWSPISDGLDAGHMTFLKEDETSPGRLFAGTMGNGAYVNDPAVDRQGDLPVIEDSNAMAVQPPLRQAWLGANAASSPTVRFALGGECPVSISIYDPAGRKVRALIENQLYMQGVHALTWDGRDSSGQRVASGVYYVRVSTPKDSETVKVVFMK
jgi:hypothetical protein